MSARQQAPWMIFVKPGDVLCSPSGDFRVVRSLSRFADGDLRTANFAIRRCSWTRRAYTCKTFTELLAFTFVAARDLPRTRLDRKLASSLVYENRMPEDQKLACWDVVGGVLP